VGITSSPILDPILEKKLLNSFAMRPGSLEVTPLIFNSVIGTLGFLPMASLSMSQVFLGFCSNF